MSYTNSFFIKLAYSVLGLTMIGAVQAQSSMITDPTNPIISTPTINYQSTFEGYQSFTDETISAWRDVNDRVSNVGGHMGTSPRDTDASMQPPSNASQHMHKHGGDHQK